MIQDENPIQFPRLWLVVLACLQSMLCSGIVFGWASVAGSLLIAPFEAGGAERSPEETTAIFCVAASTASFSSLFTGYVLDVWGPRVCSLVSHAIIFLGCFLFASATSYSEFLWGTSLMAFGGPGIQSAVVHLANLFPDNKFLVVALVSGSITLSFMILPIFDILWQHYGVGFRIMFQSYLLLIGLSALGSWFFWPDKPYDSLGYDDDDDKCDEELDKLMGTLDPATPVELYSDAASRTSLTEAPLNSYLRSTSHHNTLSRHDSYRKSIAAMASGNYTVLSIKDQPFMSQLSSGIYSRIIIVFVVTCFVGNICIAGFATELADLNEYASEQQHRFARTFTIVNALGVLGSPVVGWLMDRIGLESCTAFTLLTGMLYQLQMIYFSDNPHLLVAGFFIYTLFRDLLFPCYIACLLGRLGFKYFGILNGLGFAIAGVAQLFIGTVVQMVKGDCHLQPVEGCSRGRWEGLHVVQFFMLSFLMVIPVLDWWVARKLSTTPGYNFSITTMKTASDSYGSIIHEEAEAGIDYDSGILI